MLDISEETGPHVLRSAELAPWARSEAKSDATTGFAKGQTRWQCVCCFVEVALAVAALIGAVIATMTPGPGGPPGQRRDLPGQRGPYHP